MLATSPPWSTAANKVNCEFKIFNWIHIGKKYDCNMEELNITLPNTVITHINGTHKWDKENSDVIGIEIYNQICHYVPQGMSTHFVNIEALWIYNSSLISIYASDLKQFPKLRVLVVQRNPLQYLAGNIFEFNPELQRISFSLNKLKHIGQDIFMPLRDLQIAGFTSNTCIDSFARTPNELEELKNEIKLKCQSSEIMMQHEIARRKLEIDSEIDNLSKKLNKLRTEMIRKDDELERNIASLMIVRNRETTESSLENVYKDE